MLLTRLDLFSTLNCETFRMKIACDLSHGNNIHISSMFSVACLLYIQIPSIYTDTLLSQVFEKIVTGLGHLLESNSLLTPSQFSHQRACEFQFRIREPGKLDRLLESNSLLPPSQFSYKRAWEYVLTLSHLLQIALDRGMERRLI